MYKFLFCENLVGSLTLRFSNWYNVVWFKVATPKHAFLMWICQLNRLPIREILASWGMSTNHLILTSLFSVELWNKAQRKLGFLPTTFDSWQALTSWTKGSCQRSPSLLRNLVAHALVYGIWKQRNNLIHNHQVIPPSTVFREADQIVHNSSTAEDISRSSQT